MSQQVIHCAGWSACTFFQRANKVLSSLKILFPTKVKLVTHEFSDRTAYRAWLVDGDGAFREKLEDPRAHGHTSSPFVWISKSDDVVPNNPDANDVKSFIGGHDDTLEYCRSLVSPADGSKDVAKMVDDGHVAGHSYDYDLVVIGGGSGGLACSKEAAALGAKVAVCDFVKPSPAGSKWGLGGTCVNVGCIPKKLMHNAAVIKETIHADAAEFGISLKGGEPIPSQHSWEHMKDQIQNYIRGLNFKYRVALREANVTYLNKYAKIIDKHTLEVTDKKGNVSTITSSRFIIAVGGRPTAIDCEGGELAITSDDIFSLEQSPGKVLCVGASYISLECAGFLAGLGYDVSVAVRSILLRGFDRECADKIGAFMEDHGVTFKNKVLPKKLEKVDGRIQVTFTDDSQEVFDTVMYAIGRTACTAGIGLENVAIAANPKNGKISAKFEQSSCPNIYCIGDVMEGVAELTPVAIEAGLALAKRLFGGSSQPMDYANVCTTVFTPIEYGTVGISEDEAEELYGKDNIEVYQKSFLPLEWTLSATRQKHQAFTKVIIDKTAGEKVLGIHFLGPNAGEVMQGFGVAMKKGITYSDLKTTVGIHPTCAEEIVTLSVTKRSGEDAAAGGC